MARNLPAPNLPKGDNNVAVRPAMYAIGVMGADAHGATRALKEYADDDSIDEWKSVSAAVAILMLHIENPKVTAYALPKVGRLDVYDLRYMRSRFPKVFDSIETAVTNSKDPAFDQFRSRIAESLERSL